MTDATITVGGAPVQVNVGGGQGPRGLPSGPLGAGSVTDAEISNNAGDQVAITAKLRFLPPVTGGVSTTVANKLGNRLDLSDTGAVGLNGAGDAAYIATLFANGTPGQKIRGLRGSGLAAQFKSTSAPFVLTRGIDLDLEYGVDLRVDQTTGQRYAGLTLNVTFVDGDVAPTTAGEHRGGWLRGGRIYTYNTTTSAGDNLAGGYGIDRDGSGKATIGLTLEKMRIGGGFGAVRWSSVGGRELQWCQLVRCTLTNGVLFNAEDGEIAVDCIAGGVNTGYTFNITFGAFNTGVFRGTITSSGGAVDILDGSLIKLHNVQIEHPSTVPGGSGLPGGGHIIARGLTYTGQGNELIGCNIGAGSYITNSLELFNQRHFKIYRCQWNIAGPAGVSADIVLNRDPVDPTKDTYDTILGYDQNFRGARARQVVGSMTDVSRRMVITHAGGTLRQPHRGIWFPLFVLLTSTASALADGGLECMIDHSGMIRFNGKLTRSTFFANGMSVATFPSWLLPMAQQSFPVMGDAGVMAEGVIALTGVLSINGAGLAASANLWIPNGAWNAVVNPNYITVA